MENSLAKKVLMYAGSLFLLAASACILYTLTQPRWSENLKAEITNQPYARTITVDAEGKITSKPDIALIDLSVVVQGKTVKEVTKAGNVSMSQVIEAVKKLGIESKDIASTQYNLYPNYVYPDNRSPRIDGYNLTQNIQVKVRNLDQVDDVLDTGISAGANQVGQLTFDIDDPSALKKQAREKAFTAAKEKAKEMAQAAGVSLGRVVTFSEGTGYQPPMFANYAMKAMSADSGAPAPSIEPGTKELNLTVSVTYEID
ncbi:SIMPL domain-containing protein [Candidatus Peregrinibacteria bacterium]|nr:SIMPL domain-containing protein [Candidatus Peregrinibacteria bacterium]